MARRGHALVEGAIVFPLFFFMIGGLFDLARLEMERLILYSTAARLGGLIEHRLKDEDPAALVQRELDRDNQSAVRFQYEENILGAVPVRPKEQSLQLGLFTLRLKKPSAFHYWPSKQIQNPLLIVSAAYRGVITHESSK